LDSCFRLTFSALNRKKERGERKNSADQYLSSRKERKGERRGKKRTDYPMRTRGECVWEKGNRLTAASPARKKKKAFWGFPLLPLPLVFGGKRRGCRSQKRICRRNGRSSFLPRISRWRGGKKREGDICVAFGRKREGSRSRRNFATLSMGGEERKEGAQAISPSTRGGEKKKKKPPRSTPGQGDAFLTTLTKKRERGGGNFNILHTPT